MASKSSSFEENLAAGQAAESKIANYLKSRGGSVLPVYEVEIEGLKGPRLFSATCENVAPDIGLVSESGRFTWVEVKNKGAFAWHRKTSTWTTGVDSHHYEDYLRVKKITGLDVWLMFYHASSVPQSRDVDFGCPLECPTGLFGGEIELLNMCIHHSHPNGGTRGMVYWSPDNLQLIASVSAVELANEIALDEMFQRQSSVAGVCSKPT